MIDAACGRCNSNLPFHAQGLQETLSLVSKEIADHAADDDFARFLNMVSEKALLVASLRFDIISLGPGINPSGSPSNLKPNCLTNLLSSVPSGIFDLAVCGRLSTSAIKEIIDFASWLQHTPPAKQLEAVTPWTTSPSNSCHNQLGPCKVREMKLAVPWRPRRMNTPLSNLEKLIFITLITISDIATGIKGWSFWKLNAEIWRALLHSHDLTVPSIRDCIIWSMTVVLSETGEDLVTLEERRELVRVAGTHFMDSIFHEQGIENSVKSFYWFPEQMAHGLRMWACESLIRTT